MSLRQKPEKSVVYILQTKKDNTTNHHRSSQNPPLLIESTTFKLGTFEFGTVGCGTVKCGTFGFLIFECEIFGPGANKCGVSGS